MVCRNGADGNWFRAGKMPRRASHFLRWSGQTNRLTPHPGPLPIGWGEGESPAVSPRRWRRKWPNSQGLAIAEPTAPPDSLSPSEGERVGVRGQPRDQRYVEKAAKPACDDGGGSLGSIRECHRLAFYP